MTSTTNPENGTVTYAYDNAHHVTSRSDAMGQVTQYTYDTYGRATGVSHGTMSGGTFVPDPNQWANYWYNGIGRLAQVSFGRQDNQGYALPFNYAYGYNTAGRVTSQTMTIQMYNPNTPSTPYSTSLVANYAWDTEGKMTSMTYPSMWSPAPTYNYQYDNIGRLDGMGVAALDSGGNPISLPMATAGLGPAGELLSLWYQDPLQYQPPTVNETLTYNALLQVTGMYAGSLLNMQYNYSSTQNNGRITSSNDYVTGENVSYTYDALNRLTGATASGQTPWAETYAYDGFGNLTAKNATLPPAPTFAASYDINDHQVGMTYDANGNQLWDSGQHATAYGWNMENKLATTTSQGWPGAETWYSYDPFGRRVMQDVNPDPNGYNGGRGFAGGTWQMYFYAITGQKIETLTCGYNTGDNSPYCALWSPQYNVYFGGKLIETNGTIVVTDRLGSVRARSGSPWTTMAYYPYGEEYPSPTQDAIDKFGTYFRDGPGQDYAGQRYYNNGSGRFWSVDPGGMGTADQSDPTSLNRYAYVGGDPVNFRDPNGSDRVVIGGEVINCPFGAGSIYDGSCEGGWGGPVWPCGFGYGTVCGIGPVLPALCIGNQFLRSLNPACDEGGSEEGMPAPSCTLSIANAQGGTPINGQDLTKLGDGPSTNTFGMYKVPGGWFDAVQYQGLALGDPTLSDWRILQFATETGTQTVRTGNRTVTVPITGMVNVPDNPDPRAIYAGLGFSGLNIDWLDNPGQAFATTRGRVVGANLTFNFTASLTNTKTGAHCDVAWSFKLRF